MKVYRDAKGNLINIGEWDTMSESIMDEKTGRIKVTHHNPIPDDAIESDENVDKGADGGLFVSNDI